MPTRSSWPSASSPTPPAWPGDPEITITPRGLVAVEPRTLATTMPGVYCGGDLAFGPRIVIEAVADGKRAALAIHEALGGGAVPRARGRFRPIPLDRSGDHYDRIPRQTVPSLPVARRTGFREVEEGYCAGAGATRGRRAASGATWRRSSTRSAAFSAAAASRSARRPASRWCRCRACEATPELDALREALGADEAAGAIVKDEERCIRCGLCAERCPTGAITMEALELDESPQTALGLFHEGMSEGPR